MNCSNCGGRMELVATRGYFFCRYCGSFHFPETATDEGIRILGDSASQASCAICSQPLAAALLDERHPVQYCRNCRGVLAARMTFADVVQLGRAWATDPPGPPVPLNPKELDRRVTCPSCKRAMATHPYYGPGNVVIDNCFTCDLVWLDFGELTQILAAPGRDRGRGQLTPTTFPREPSGVRREMDPDGADAGDLLDLLTKLF